MCHYIISLIQFCMLVLSRTFALFCFSKRCRFWILRPPWDNFKRPSRHVFVPDEICTSLLIGTSPMIFCEVKTSNTNASRWSGPCLSNLDVFKFEIMKELVRVSIVLCSNLDVEIEPCIGFCWCDFLQYFDALIGRRAFSLYLAGETCLTHI